MTDEYQGAAGFLNGLSDLWIRFFQDKNQLEAYYRGSEILIAQTYLDILSNSLNTSVRETPVFNRDLFKLITIREDEITYDPSTNRYVYLLPDNVKSFEFMNNKVFSPTAVLQNTKDFDVDITGEEDALQFYADPFDWDGAGNPIPGFAYRRVEVVDDDDNVTSMWQLAFWLPEAEVDHYNLYLTYGYLLSRFEPSSESYRSLLMGIMRYFVLGPTFDYMESALNVISGLAVIRDDGEILQEVDYSDSLVNVVKTDKDEYTFEKVVPLKDYIEDTANWGTLTLNALDVITATFTVKDAVAYPTWWHDIIIPQKLIPDETRERRIVSPDIYDNLIDNPTGLVRIGDPGFMIGADDDGFVPSTRVAKRHLFSFIVFERFLRHHVFTVDIDSSATVAGVVPFLRDNRDFQEIIIAGSSAYTFLYMEPDVAMTDTVYMSSDVDVTVQPTVESFVFVRDSGLTIGIKSWNVGDYFTYAASGAITIGNGTPTPSAAETPVVIGGAHPGHLTPYLADDESGTYTAARSDPGTGHAQITITGKDVFDEFDVGHYLVTENDDGDYGPNYRRIVQVIDARTVYVNEGPTTGSGLEWSLWTDEGGQEGAACIDWPVQIRVTP